MSGDSEVNIVVTDVGPGTAPPCVSVPDTKASIRADKQNVSSDITSWPFAMKLIRTSC
jgi:hypothetical protein